MEINNLNMVRNLAFIRITEICSLKIAVNKHKIKWKGTENQEIFKIV